jgi:hypothetical protein
LRRTIGVFPMASMIEGTAPGMSVGMRGTVLLLGDGP